MEENEYEEAEIRLAAKRCANANTHTTRATTLTLLYPQTFVPGLSSGGGRGRGSQDVGKQDAVVSTPATVVMRPSQSTVPKEMASSGLRDSAS